MFPAKIISAQGKTYLPDLAIIPAPSYLYRVRKDGELPYPPVRGWGDLHMLPAVFPMRAVNYNGVITDSSGEVRTQLPQAWMDCFASMNTDRGAAYLFKDNSGLFNGGTDKGLEQLLMSDNIVAIPEKRYSNGRWWGRVDTYDVHDAPPAMPLLNRKQKFNIIREDLMTIVDTPVGAVYWLLVSHVPVWFAMELLEKV